MSVVTVCKNVIASNNKRGWKDPDPAIRVAATKSGKAILRGHTVIITDKAGNAVATINSTADGRPVVKCGAKVAIFTTYPVEVVREGKCKTIRRVRARA